MDGGVTLVIHHGGRFQVDEFGELRYLGGEVKEVSQVDVDKLTDREVLWYGKDLQYDNIERFFYQIPGMGLKDGLRTCEDDLQSLDMARATMVDKKLTVYFEHRVDEAEVLGPVGLSLTSPQSLSPAEGGRVKLPVRRNPFSKIQRPSHVSPQNKDDSSKPLFVPEQTSRSGPDITQQVGSYAFTTSGLGPSIIVQNTDCGEDTENAPEWDWEDPRPESPIPWRELVGDYGDEDDVGDANDADWEEEHRKEMAASTSYARAKRSKRKLMGTDEPPNEPYEEAGYEDYDAEEDEEMSHTGDYEDMETTDDEWGEASLKLQQCERHIHEIVEKANVMVTVEGNRSIAKTKTGEGTKETQTRTVVVQRREVELAKGFVSEYEDSEEEMDADTENDDDDDTPRLLRKRRKHSTIDGSTNFMTLKWSVGMIFPSAKSFKDAVASYAIAQGRSIRIGVSNSNRRRVGAVCKEGCGFRLYCCFDKALSSWVVRTVDGTHTCSRNMRRNPQLTYKWVAKHYLQRFKAQPNWSAKELIRAVRLDHGICLESWTAFKAKQVAKKMLHGSMFDHYAKVGSYMEELNRSNSGSRFLVQTYPETEEPTFQRFFVCFEGLVKGVIDGCRPILVIDGTFLKTFLGGCLLAAIGMDGNNQMFPVAWAVVEGENSDSWEWFLAKLRDCLEGTIGVGLSIISDEHQAILAAVAKVFPDCEHRHCARHIYSNWKKLHKGEEFKLLFWKASKAYNQTDFKEALEELKEVSQQAYEDFLNHNRKYFCRAFMRTDSKCDVIVSNMAKTFNAYIVEARHKHLIYMLEDIRAALMERMVVKKALMENSSDTICPRIRKRLELEKDEARNCFLKPTGNKIFEVTHRMDTLQVDMNTASCTSRKWDLSGYPCCHAIACATWLKEDAELYVNDFFKKAKYLRAYQRGISPCLGERHWPARVLPVRPPPIKIMPGRPRKNRRKAQHEDRMKPGRLTRHGRQMTYTLCQGVGHSKKGCPNKSNNSFQQAPMEKRPRGRPRKQPQESQSSQMATADRGNGIGRIGGGRKQATSTIGRGSGRMSNPPSDANTRHASSSYSTMENGPATNSNSSFSIWQHYSTIVTIYIAPLRSQRRTIIHQNK